MAIYSFQMAMATPESTSIRLMASCFCRGESGAVARGSLTYRSARVDRYDRVWVCDRQNWRIQIFDLDGNYLTEWTDLARPDTVFFDPQDDVVYIAEVEGQVSIYTFDGELITKWGGAKRSDILGGFLGGPHGIWMDSHGDLYVGEVETTDRFQKFIRQ